MSYVVLRHADDTRKLNFQVLWNSSCLDLLLISVHNELTSGPVSDPAWVATVRSLYQKIAREWTTSALSYAPCTTQGLIQVQLI